MIQSGMRAHRASRAAVRVGRGVLVVGADPRRAPLLPAGAAETTATLMQAAGLRAAWQRRLERSAGARSMLAWGEQKLLPGHSTHLALRKRAVDDETRAAVEAGATQVLNVGAGLDTLALRLAPAYPRVRFVEVDHPATQSLKRHAVEQLGLPPNVQLYPADLAETPLPEVLDARDWDRGARSVVIIEGMLMFLDGNEIADFLRGTADVMGHGSRLVGTYLLPDPPGRPRPSLGGGLNRLSQEVLGEPPRWTVTTEALVALLVETGFTPGSSPGRVDLRLRYLVPAGLDDLPLATTERLLLADRS